ncbi:MAG: L-seryl-tRNA(Sec) selenium transferase [Deltaproteobacteria bacterium]|nr:L-seryl-tRNA(Sec) selenium transferase [Deltaproteobacteria bacterium]
MPENQNLLYRALPSMSVLLNCITNAGYHADEPWAAPCLSSLADVPRTLLRESVENFLDNCRIAIREGEITDSSLLSLPALLPDLVEYAIRRTSPSLRRVLNATGIIIHTNLGRSRLAEEAVTAVAEAARYPSNLEFDLQKGTRGSRHSHVASLICRMTGAQAALAVNNNAAAVLLVLDTLCRDREVIVSRGELVEIGGNFRIPDVIKKSGCLLREVGTTNRTHLSDFRLALSEHTGAILKVHTSNYRIIGFTQEAGRAELAALANSASLPFIEDLGSGVLVDLAAQGFPHLGAEPAVAKVIADGADIVTFSGDKVLGGPQAGIIAGKLKYIEQIAKNPLLRALRMDKLNLAALEATLRLYLEPTLARTRIPTLRMMTTTADELLPRARKLARLLKKTLPAQKDGWLVAVRSGISQVGGGAFPEMNLPTWLTTMAHPSPHFNPAHLQKMLLQTKPPLLARVEDNALRLDLRTLDDREIPLAAAVLAQTAAPMFKPPCAGASKY